MKKSTIKSKWRHTEGVTVKKLTPEQRYTALRQATYPLVEDIVNGLVAQGLTIDEACKAIRWATHVKESTVRYKK